MKDDFLVPKKWKSDIRKTFDINDKALSRKFDLYAENICKNTGLKNYLSEQQNNKCAWCGESLEDNPKGYGVIHHVEYDNFCTGPTYTWYKDGEEKEVPNCLGCSFKNMCTSNLYVVHSKCNKEINDVQLNNNNNKHLSLETKEKNNTITSQMNDVKAVESLLDKKCGNINGLKTKLVIHTSKGKVDMSEKEWFSQKRESFSLFQNEYHKISEKYHGQHEYTDAFIYNLVNKADFTNDVLFENDEEYFTIETLYKNRDAMKEYYSIDPVLFCQAYNLTTQTVYVECGICQPLKLPYLYHQEFDINSPRTKGISSDFNSFDLSSQVADIYNLEDFDIIPLYLEVGDTFVFDGDEYKRGNARIFLCKELYDYPEIRQWFDGCKMSKTLSKNILRTEGLLDRHPWVKEYLNPNA